MTNRHKLTLAFVNYTHTFLWSAGNTKGTLADSFWVLGIQKILPQTPLEHREYKYFSWVECVPMFWVSCWKFHSPYLVHIWEDLLLGPSIYCHTLAAHITPPWLSWHSPWWQTWHSRNSFLKFNTVNMDSHYTMLTKGIPLHNKSHVAAWFIAAWPHHAQSLGYCRSLHNYYKLAHLLATNQSPL